MRSSIIAAAFVAGALAVPLEKRATYTDYDIVYVTQVVTVTAGQPAPTHKSSSHHYHHSASTTKKTTAVTTKSSTKASPVSTSTSSAATVAPVSTSKTSTGKSSTHSTTMKSTTKKSSTRAPSPSSTSKSSTKVASPISATKSAITTTAKSSTKAATSTKASTSAASAAPTGYQNIAVFHHNLHRSNHSAPDIKWSTSLASTAQKIAQSCNYAHNTQVDGGGYGQNIAAGVKPDNISAIITDLFYNGEEEWFANLYGQAQPDMSNFEHWGHFSQVVWAASTSLGCYTQDCSSQGLQGVASDVAPYFTVCNYESPGNYANEYGDNIGSPLGHPTAQWNTGL